MTASALLVANLGFRRIVDRRTLWPDRPTARLWRGCGSRVPPGVSLCDAGPDPCSRLTRVPLTAGAREPLDGPLIAH